MSTCCDPNASNLHSYYCKDNNDLKNSLYCAWEPGIKNPIMQNFVCPTDTRICPADLE
jgi:uncharacterized protein YktB (UPF0637 family)